MAEPREETQEQVTEERPSWADLYTDDSEWDSLEYDDPRLDDFAFEVEKQYGIPAGLLVAVKNAGERTPSKASGRRTVSHKGAAGIMQIMPAMRRAYKHDYNNPFESIDAAGKILRDELKRYRKKGGEPFAEVAGAVAHYNGGRKAGLAAAAGKWDELPDETYNYLARIRNYAEKKAKGNTGG